MRRITIALAVLAIALGSAVAWAQTPIAGTPHDFTGAGSVAAPPGGGIVGGGTTGVNLGITEYCLPCHAPHNGGNTSTNQYGPLWNHSLSVAASFTQKTKTLTLGSNLPANSALCLGCHDGQTAVSSFNVANANQTVTAAQADKPIGSTLNGSPWLISVFGGGTVYTGALAPTGDLSNTHPIKTYPNPPYTGYATENAVTGTVGTSNLPLETLSNTNISHGTAGTYIGCTTCHNPHDNTNGKFLRVSNAGSALCLNCHLTIN